MSQEGKSPLKTGKTYVFSMKVKGNKVNAATALIFYHGFKKLSEEKIERGDRGSAKVTRNEAEQFKVEPLSINAGSQWTEVHKEFTVKFENKDLADLPEVTDWHAAIAVTLSPGSGVLYVDDMKLTEK